MPAEGTSAPGHLLCRGPNVMLGYLNRAEETAETLDADGFLHTGDIATVNADGVLHDRRPAQGADQVQGLPDRSGGARGAAPHAPGIADAAVIGTSRRRRPGGADGVRGAPARRRRRAARRGRGHGLRGGQGGAASRRSAGWSSSTPCRSPPPAKSCAGSSRRLRPQQDSPPPPGWRSSGPGPLVGRRLSWRCKRRRGRCGPRSWQRSRARAPAPCIRRLPTTISWASERAASSIRASAGLPRAAA